MSEKLAELHEWYLIHNVQAFLRVLRAGESNQDDSAFRLLFGGEMFQSFRDHPRKAVTRTLGGKPITSTAAGAYQFLSKTWDGLVKQYGFPDFTPLHQHLGAIALIKERKALDAVIGGRFDEAVRACATVWASLPGSPYGQPTLSLEKARAVYSQYGGSFAGPASPPVPSEVRKPMAPIVIPILQGLTALLPQLGSLFGSGSEVSNRNIAAGTILAQTITRATESINLQEAAEKIENDPAMRAAANAAIAEVWPTITEAGGGGIDGARKAAASTDAPPFWKQAPIWFFLSILPLVYMLAASVLFKVGGVEWSSDALMLVATSVVGIIGLGAAFFLGSSLGSQKKDGLISK